MNTTTKNAPPMKTIEDAKLVQVFVEHLKELRKTSDYLSMHKNAQATTIKLSAPINEALVPDEARRDARNNKNSNWREYTQTEGKWTLFRQLQTGTFDPRSPHSYGNGSGCFPTPGRRVMDAVRAAVNDEIEATENEIHNLGYEVPTS